MTNLFKRIYTGTLAKYNAKGVKEENSLYLVYDESTGVKSMYKGTEKVGGDFIIVNGPAPASPEKGVIYYISAFVKEEGQTGKPFVGFWDGTNWVALSDSATIEALDSRITSLEGATKIDGNATEGSIGEAVHTLIGNASVEGSVKKQIKDASDAIKGNLGEGDASTLEAINDELDTINTTLGGIKLQLVEPTGTNVKEEYKLVNGNGDITGSAHIKVYKDQTLKSAEFDGTTQELVLTYILSDGTEKVVKVDISALIIETEVENGIQAVNHKLSIKIDGNGEEFLTVGTEGLKLSGVQSAIDEAVASKNVAAEGDAYVSATAANNKVTVSSNVVKYTDAHAAEGESKEVTGLADILDVKTVITENERVTSAALNDLDGRIGVNENLTTTEKVIVPAINELKTAIESKNVNASGDEYVGASAANNTITVTTTQSTKDSLALADSAVQTVKKATENQEVTVEASYTTKGTKEVTIGVTKATYTQATFNETTGDVTTEGVFTAEGLVASDVMKKYIADEIAKNSIYWETL